MSRHAGQMNERQEADHVRLQDKFQGCLIGGAAGDALGYEIEFDSIGAIQYRYGSPGITRFELHNEVALFSDDTQMTLFTGAGLLNGRSFGATPKSIPGYTECIRVSYLDWLVTQNNRYPRNDIPTHSWLMSCLELYSWRAPGNTCLSALSAGGRGSVAKPINHSKGCGGVMRVAPIGLFFADSGLAEEEIDRLGAEAAALTHGHELGYIPSAALVHIVHRISACGDTPRAAVEHCLAAMPKLFPDAANMGAFLNLMEQAVKLSETAENDLNAIRNLGEGWVAEETLAIAVYCALRYPNDFEKALIASVNHSGDSDSTGAVLGNILGAWLGYQGIPDCYKEKLELRDTILKMADELWSCPPITEQP